MPDTVTRALGYDQSPNYLSATELEERPFAGYTHVYRKAREACGLKGVYLLSDPRKGHRGEVPVVFYCEAENEVAANKIHQRVWNQGVVPFVLVATPKTLRLYSGFSFGSQDEKDQESRVLRAVTSFNEVAERLADFRAEAIDSGLIWESWGQEVNPAHKVDGSLLRELERLGVELRERGLGCEHSHALIGKLVYLKYLRDRDILSDRKLEKWGLTEAEVFGPRATLRAFEEINSQLNEWLNGSVFPLPEGAIRADHLQLATSVFAGGTSRGQLALDLGIYDFSLIPIETLSVIYENFLHAAEDGKTSRGREAGAYYTPIPLVNYMLGELEARRPLSEGMRVLDPSCGSGVFLVQCYRALIEKRLEKGRARPSELRDLLTRHIFGVDRDGDACRVAELSLLLTLLDYIAPPDLESTPQFKLPVLRENNIFHADFFDQGSSWAQKRSRLKVDWLVGNPPWREVNQRVAGDRFALEWIKSNAEDWPIGGNQVAEAFVWHALPLLSPDAVSALLLPAMTLFKMESRPFRARLFETVRAWLVTNFANLAYVLFAGRSQAPASALFFEPRQEPDPAEESIRTLAPFLVNHPIGRSQHSRRNRETWSVLVNSTEMRELRSKDVADGDFRPWKEAMWGSHRDTKLLERMARKFPTLEEFGKGHKLSIHEGFQLRNSGAGTEPMPSLVGKQQVDFSRLRHCGRILAFPPEALSQISGERANLRKRGGEKGLQVSEPPHVLIDVGRRFAVFSDEFIAVPPRQIGVHGPEEQVTVLRALSLFLSSDFCRYQQFFTSPQWGVRNSISTLRALRSLPVPLGDLSGSELREWAGLQESLAAETLAGTPPSTKCLAEIDARVYELLGVSQSERVLIGDFLFSNLQVVKGKVPAALLARPADQTLEEYLLSLKSELDTFIGQESGLSHELSVVRGKSSAMLAIRLVRGPARVPSVVDADRETSAALAKTRQHLLEQHSQWLYFERSLKVYQDGAMYVFKPLEMIHWTRRQAILDADEIIAETLGSEGT
ncbi:MAG: SAM-dependent DNA methyltransferase [Acidobacteria bacterium]|nr:SAM-dependent DNA methyltransferase [Acidobacteriota bacterium]